MSQSTWTAAGVFLFSASPAWACWDAQLTVSAKGPADSRTRLTIAWEPLEQVGQCSSEIGDFSYYRLESGETSAPSAKGGGEVVALLSGISTDRFVLHTANAETTVHLALFACDSSDACTPGSALSNYQLTATTDP